MAHEHTHDHHHHGVPEHINRAFVIGILLNAFFVVAEAIAGFLSHSLALLTDAGHNLSDVASLGLSLLAFRLARIKPTNRFTYGFRKTTILAALANAVILLVGIGGIGWEAVQRLWEPHTAQGKTIALVAGLGIVVNAVTAFFFFHNRKDELNVKSAYLHLAADALVSAGVVVAGIVMVYTQWYWLDSVVSLLIAVIIFITTWNLLKETLRLSMDGVPSNVNMAEVQKAILDVPGVQNIHHLHVWGLSTTVNALTAHVVVGDAVTITELETLKEKIKHGLQHAHVQHVTLEFEKASLGCHDATEF
jgi:cobalt-zinc-cadmium efflux system protein